MSINQHFDTFLSGHCGRYTPNQDGGLENFARPPTSLHLKGAVPPTAFNRENRWSSGLQNIQNLTNTSEFLRNTMLDMLKKLKEQVQVDIENMS